MNYPNYTKTVICYIEANTTDKKLNAGYFIDFEWPWL